MTLFLVTRTSLDEEEKPCEEAVQREVGVGDFFYGPLVALPSNWFSEGRKHEIISHKKASTFKRIIDRSAWTVELLTLGDLLAFSSKYGEVIICPSDGEDIELPSLEIYDYYKE